MNLYCAYCGAMPPDHVPTCPSSVPEIAIGGELDKVAANIAAPTLTRIRTLCEPCKGSGVIGRASIRRCGTCGGWGYIDECDADFGARVMENVKSSRYAGRIHENVLVPVICEHGPGEKCINCDAPHSTSEGSA